jgi:hypothetical protein
VKQREKRMLDNIKLYIIALLLIATIGFGYTTYHLTGKLAVSEASVSTWQEAANKNAESVRVASESCAISLKTVHDAQKAIDALSESRTSDLEALDAISHITIPEIRIDGTQKPTAPRENADNDRLSADTMRLLDNAYCSGNKDDPHCTTR